MTDYLLTALAAVGAYWYVHDARKPGTIDRRIAVFDYRTCPECDVKLPRSQIDIQAHGLQHRARVSR